MAFNSSYNSMDENTDLAYDLRQKYAEIVGAILEEIALARKNKKFIEWFDLLDDLHTEINQKLDIEDRQEYRNILKETVLNLNRHKEAYLGRNQNSEEIGEVHKIIKKLDMFLRDKMEKYRMFGSKEDWDSIED